MSQSDKELQTDGDALSRGAGGLLLLIRLGPAN